MKIYMVYTDFRWGFSLNISLTKIRKGCFIKTIYFLGLRAPRPNGLSAPRKKGMLGPGSQAAQPNSKGCSAQHTAKFRCSHNNNNELFLQNLFLQATHLFYKQHTHANTYCYNQLHLILSNKITFN